MKIIKPLALFFLFCFSCLAQNSDNKNLPGASNSPPDRKAATKECTLESSTMPLLKKVRIGSSYDDVKMSFPEIESNEWFQKDYRVNKSGLFMISAKDISDTELKTDLKQFSLNFENGAVRIYNFIYKSSKWNSFENMISDLSQIFNVDEDYWIIDNSQSIEMRCKDFTVYASHIKYGNKINNSIAVHRK